MNDGYKIAFIDIDWTILNHNNGHYFDMVSIEAIKKAQNDGLLIYFCTARTYASTIYTGLFDLIKPDGIICTNGNVIFVGDNLLDAITFPEEMVQKILKVANRHHVVLEFAGLKDKYYTNDINQNVKNYLSIYYEEKVDVRKKETKNVTEILAFIPEKYDERLIKELPSELKYYRYDTFGVNISYKQSTKGEAVRKVLNHLGIDKKCSLAFGDSADDISMFEEAGTSIAMKNAKSEEVKEKATIVTETIDEHGVATIIANLLY